MMMPPPPRSRLLRAVLGILLLAGAPDRAEGQVGTPSDSAAILAVVERLFDAMARRDTAAARDLLVPGARFVSLRSSSPTAIPRQQTDTAFLRSLATGRERLHERMWNPVVRVHGALADVWAPYDFHADGRFSHCGVDIFALLRVAGAWRLVSIVYTVETTGCPPSPLGPPKLER